MTNYRNKYPTQEQVRRSIEVSYPDMFVPITGIWPDGSKCLDHQNEITLLCQVCYGEARNQPPEGIAAVAQVIMNRWNRQAAYWGLTVAQVILDVDGNGRCEFCCMDSDDVNYKKLFDPEPVGWYKVVRAVLPVYLYPRPVNRSSAYFYATEKGAQTSFFRKLRHLETIGDHLFFTDLRVSPSK